MALFQRKPQTSDPKTFYTLGLNKTLLLVGLGNPGPDYELTRHNAGFICLDDFVAKSEGMDDWINKKDFKCLLSSGQLGPNRVVAIKPQTFMNLSGEAVQAVAAFYKINPSDVLVVHDELDIDFGQIRLRMGGSSAGHNGVKSIIQHLGEDFGRVRVGVGPKPPKIDSEKFVLQKFSEEQQAQLANLRQEVTAILSEYVYGSELPHETRSFIV